MTTTLITHDPREFIRGLQQILISDSKRIGFLFGAGTSHILWRAHEAMSEEMVLVCGRCATSMDVAWTFEERKPLPDWASVVAVEQTAGRGVDVAFETAWADQETTAQAAQMTRRGGKLMMVGIPREDLAVFPAHSVRRKGVTIKYVRRMKHAYPRAIAMVRDGLIDLDSLITHHFDLKDAGNAYELVASYKEGVIKAMIHVGR